MAMEQAAAANVFRISGRLSARLDPHRHTFAAQLAAAESFHLLLSLLPSLRHQYNVVYNYPYPPSLSRTCLSWP